MQRPGLAPHAPTPLRDLPQIMRRPASPLAKSLVAALDSPSLSLCADIIYVIWQRKKKLEKQTNKTKPRKASMSSAQAAGPELGEKAAV